MDFVEFDSFNTDDKDVNLPQPQPALSLPIASNLENLSKKFSGFSLSRKLTLTKNDNTMNNPQSQENDVMDKYAKLSLSLLKGEEISSSPVIINQNVTGSLSTRLSRVFNGSISDARMRDIFTSLEDKLDHNVECYQELVEPGFMGTVSRKKLKGRIEQELIKNQTTILKEYQPIVKQLKHMEAKLKKLNELNTQTNDRLQKNFQFSHEFNTTVNKLYEEKQLIGIKKDLLEAFKKKFTLNEYEEYVLVQGDLNDEFFTAMRKAESIVDNCSILLAEDNPQLGLKIMSKTNAVISKAIERSVHYCHRTLDNLYSLNSKSRLITLHKCFQVLRDKDRFDEIIDKFSESRSKDLLHEFYNQVQGQVESPPNERGPGARSATSSSTDIRPLFLSAHDPVRFVGDFLAYIHSIAVNESETITNIFTMGDDNDHQFDSIIQNVTNKILRALSKPIKSRIEQIISAETKFLTIFQIFNLVELYSMMFGKQLHQSDDLVSTMRVLVCACQDRIFTIVSNKIATISSSNSARLELNLDLQPPEWIIDFYSEILPMIDQVASDTILHLSQEENDRFLALIINQPIKVFTEHVQDNKIFTKRDSYIIRFNFLDLIQSKIMPISLLSDKVLELNDLNNDLIAKLTDLELTSLLQNCGLYDYYNIINMICPFSDDFFEPSIYEPIKENKLYSMENLQKVDTTLQEYVPNAMIEIQQSLLRLNSPVTVTDVVNNVFLEFVKFVEKLDSINREYLEFNFTWSDFELATMLGIDEVYVTYKQNLNSIEQ
ncbi:Cog6 protein [Candida orthopsilosis Co 90-125]|uniref:Conserved oligomeric Golgi complex subunit 6 n=1 Tax=Candida orthopsilosis (strain 90-125) TaxID=1136231 RepID=H8WYI9_CANO9|nr:Cog6 protein [Candida orthopsilosis Co 90-125]CCG21304.1 Cog6 protein [Candida orthopsilosis Co 90-125]